MPSNSSNKPMYVGAI